MNPSAHQGIKPWEQPVWKPAPTQGSTLFFLILIHVLALIGIILFPIPTPGLLVAALVMVFLGGLGTTVGYHRTQSHRTLKLNSWVEHFLIFCAMFSGSGAPISWVSFHRWHHAKSDTPDDISSPKHGGFWWAHLRWLYQLAPADYKKWCPDLDLPRYWFWTRVQPILVAVAILCGLPFGWKAFFWLGAIRLVYSLHMQCFVNSIMHMSKAKDGDSSMNVWWLSPFHLGAGENWHRNHHMAAGSARLGWRWWQVDMGWYLIVALEALGLASNVKRPRLHQ